MKNFSFVKKKSMIERTKMSQSTVQSNTGINKIELLVEFKNQVSIASQSKYAAVDGLRHYGYKGGVHLLGFRFPNFSSKQKKISYKYVLLQTNLDFSLKDFSTVQPIDLQWIFLTALEVVYHWQNHFKSSSRSLHTSNQNSLILRATQVEE